MGTRADFYVGVGREAEWIGSLGYDGYRIDDMKEEHKNHTEDCAACWAIKNAKTESEYRAAVTKLLSLNDDATTPDQGWPWPWDDSCTTDYAYAFADGTTKVFYWGRPRDASENGPKDAWPNMADSKNVTFGQRSGMIVIGG